jgi:hypothetical protein
MATTESIIESLFHKTEAYGKTNIELLQLQAAQKTAEFGAVLFSRLLLTAALLFFGLLSNIALALYWGEIFGKTYLGFTALAGLYAILSVVLILAHPAFVRRTKNRIIAKLFT